MRWPPSRRSSANLERPWLGPFRKADHELLVPGARAERQPRADSAARATSSSTACWSSPAPIALRFTSELASDFLAHLGVVAAICIENAVNRARLVRSGLTDFLTGFHNRRYLHARLREELARAQRARQPHRVPDDRRRSLQAHQRPVRTSRRRCGAARGGAAHRCRDAHQRHRRALRRRRVRDRAAARPRSSDGEKVAARVLHAVRNQPIAIGKAARPRP